MGRSQRHKVYIQGFASNHEIVAQGQIAGIGDAHDPPASLFPIVPGLDAPTVTSLSPNTAVKGAADLTMTVVGTNFFSGTKIMFNGGAENTTFVDSTHVSTTVKPSLVSTAISVPVGVVNGPYPSNTQPFTFTDT
jgi:IPT/TIG domain